MIKSMKFCSAELCPSCPFAGNKSACLRQKAEFCLWLVARTSNRDLRAAVKRMRLQLMKEAYVLEKERGQTAT
jgi:hypothetical protein